LCTHHHTPISKEELEKQLRAPIEPVPWLLTFYKLCPFFSLSTSSTFFLSLPPLSILSLFQNQSARTNFKRRARKTAERSSRAGAVAPYVLQITQRCVHCQLRSVRFLFLPLPLTFLLYLSSFSSPPLPSSLLSLSLLLFLMALHFLQTTQRYVVVSTFSFPSSHLPPSLPSLLLIPILPLSFLSPHLFFLSLSLSSPFSPILLTLFFFL
jgi:hypothetical protein